MQKLPVPPFAIAAVALVLVTSGAFFVGRQSTVVAPVATPMATPNPLYAADAQKGNAEIEAFIDNAKTQKELDEYWNQIDLGLTMAASRRPERIPTVQYYLQPLREKSDKRRATLPPN